MSSSVLVHRVRASAVAVLEAKEWRDDVLRRHRAGARVLTLYGQRRDDRVSITTVFRDGAGAIQLTRADVSAQFGYHELTSQIPALHCFERELHEQTGVRVAGHPWLKPIRYAGQEQTAMNGYPFYVIQGKEVHEVAVGPIHAGVIEPGSFRFMCLGEQVHHLEIHLGYQHRGVEQRLLQGDPRRLAPLVETVAGDSSIAHAWAYLAALESLSGCALDIETEVARAVALELERVAMHLAGLSGLAADLGFLQGATTYGRLRTTAINTTMRLCGSRFGRGALRPGGIGMRLPPSLLDAVHENLALLRTDLAIINDCFLGAHTVQHRLRGVGTLTEAQARELGLVGMAARASGVLVDARHQVSAGAYLVVPIEPQVLHEGGDCWARARIRIAELDASLLWLQVVLSSHGSWERPLEPLGPLAPDEIAVAVVEGWRGEVVHCLETNQDATLSHYKVQDPSLRNWMGLAMAVRGNEISDFPICNKSFDLSYCGNDL
jgi:Ni,Fe-hydrogenase III large subunit